MAETQVIFSDYVSRITTATGTSGTGILLHSRNAANPNDTTIMRINFDTRYSYVILDLSNEATLTMPETNGRYQSVWFITEEHYNPMAINAPELISSTKKIWVYVMAVIRTQVNMRDSAEMVAVTALQDQIQLSQSDKGSYTASHNWSMEEILEKRAYYQTYSVENHITADMMFGKKGELSLENHNCGTAYGWGGFTPDQAVYLNYIPTEEQKIGATLTLSNVPIANNAFWSITIYDGRGFPQGEFYNINSVNVIYNENGDAIIHFGGDQTAENYMDIFDGWNFVLRMYLPQDAYFNGSWTKPELVAIE